MIDESSIISFLASKQGGYSEYGKIMIGGDWLLPVCSDSEEHLLTFLECAFLKRLEMFCTGIGRECIKTDSHDVVNLSVGCTVREGWEECFDDLFLQVVRGMKDRILIRAISFRKTSEGYIFSIRLRNE